MASVPDASIGFLLQNVVEFIESNYDLISGAEEPLQNLCDALGDLKAFVEDQTKSSASSFLDHLADGIRDLVYKSEDIVETFVVITARQKLKGRIEKFLHQLDYNYEVRKLAQQIVDISEEVKEFYTRKDPLFRELVRMTRGGGGGGGGGGEGERKRERNLKLPVVEGDDVVGLQNETDIIIDLLTEGKRQLDVLSIFGMYGLGKTTLAKKVYNDLRIQRHFDIRIFVNVSLEFETKEIFMKIICSLVPSKKDVVEMSEDELAMFILQYLEASRYLIVLDDVWGKDAWDTLKFAFPDHNNGSRILITTREIDVAKYTGSTSELYQMPFLQYEDARKLLRLKVFGHGRNLPELLEPIEERILERCQGLPLAIVVTAGVLTNHRDDAYWWKKVAEGAENEDPIFREQTDYVINMSFDCLPYDLKSCFLYLGVFPQDFEIPVRTLLRLWVSEGLIPPGEGNLSSEELAAFYLQNLINRSLVMVQKRSSNDQVKTIKIHYTIHKFCKARGERENLFHEIKGTTRTPAAAAGITDKFRRLCVDLDYIRAGPSGKQVRSLLCFCEERESRLPLDNISSIVSSFKLLRVLDIRSIRLPGFPSHLYYLVLLRYIAISGSFKLLPEKMSNLWNLQTLIVETTGSTTLEIKANIGKMAQLRHLETNTPVILTGTKEGSSVNANLQTLSIISPDSCTRKVFDRTPMLKKLGVSGNLALILEDGREFGILVSRLEKLENLKLLNKAAEKIRSLPSSDLFPRKLVKLTLLNTLLHWKEMSTLGKLENLQVLKLKDNAFAGTAWNTEDGGFKRLKVLHIGKSDLREWNASSSHFPVLTRLYLKHCSKLEGIPEDLKGISMLQMIDLYCTNYSVVRSARSIMEAKLGSEKPFWLSVYPPHPEE